MKAVWIKYFGGPEQLEIREIETPPHPQGNEVLVGVRAAGLNRADLLQRKGLYPPPKGFPERVPGLEFAGEVAETGGDVKDLRIGDRVFGITAGGAQAEFVLTKEDQLLRVPEDLDFVQAAAVPEAYITAYDAVWTQCRLSQGETLLIHAVGSGVGRAALDIAKLHSNRVIGTSRTGEKLERCRDSGLDVAINTSEIGTFSEAIKRDTDGKGVDVILDLVGAGYLDENLKSLALKGRLILVGLVGGRKADFDLGIALRKRLQIIGTVLRSRSDAEKALATERFGNDLLGDLEEQNLAPNVDRVFGFEEAEEAHRYLGSNKSFGKVVLKF